MGTIEIHDGVTNRQIQVPIRGTIKIYSESERIEVPGGYEVVIEDEVPNP